MLCVFTAEGRHHDATKSKPPPVTQRLSIDGNKFGTFPSSPLLLSNGDDPHETVAGSLHERLSSIRNCPEVGEFGLGNVKEASFCGPEVEESGIQNGISYEVSACIMIICLLS